MSERELGKSVDGANALVQRLFVRAAQRLGGSAALGQHLGLTYSELRAYLSGEARAPTEVLLRTVDLVIEDLDVIKDGFSEEVWRALWPSFQTVNKE